MRCTFLPDVWGYFFETIQQINGKNYSLGKVLGNGGFSKVYLAVCKHNNKSFAIKRITIGSKKEKERTLQEIGIFKSHRDHPNILTLYDSSFLPSTQSNCEDAYLILEYFPCGSLFDLINLYSKSDRYLEENLILNIALGVCHGLKELHDSNPPIIHRDIKPHNILLREDMIPVITDFGSSFLLSSKYEFSQKRGLQEEANENTTQAYCPPELLEYGGMFDNYPVDQRVDIWAIGCLLYHCAFFNNPFDREIIIKGGSIKMAIQNGNYSFDKDSVYSQDFHKLISSLIVVDPSNRPFISDCITLLSRLREKSVIIDM